MLIISSIIFLLALIATNVTTIDAASISDKEGMAAAPSGIPINDLGSTSLFVQGPNTFPSGIENGDVIQVINGSHYDQVASIWSNNAVGTDNYFDTGSKQKLSVWIYMGGSNFHGSEGMAFVLQNSGTDAIAKNGNKIAGGETLGVWGSDLSRKATSTAMASSAIQKSWALEFDGIPTGNQNGVTLREGVGGKAGETLDSYQVGINGFDNYNGVDYAGHSLNTGFNQTWGHIAWSYPGYKDSYLNIGKGASGILTVPVYELVHTDIHETDFVTPKTAALAWHHLTITYTPPETGSTMANVSYVFNDKTIDGLVPPPGDIDQVLIKQDLKMDLSKLDAKVGDPLYYGFVAANSSEMDSATNAVVFEELPSIVEADKNAYVVDETNKTKVSSSTDVMMDDDRALTETTTVHPNDKLRFNYMLKYQSGKKDMSPVAANINVPDNVTVKSDSLGNIGRVTYYNGSSEPIPASALKDEAVTDKATGKTSTVKMLTYDLKDALNLTNPWANIELNATADAVPDVNTALEVPYSHAALEGDNYKTDMQTPPFTIQAARATLTLTKTSNDVSTTSPNLPVDLTGDIKIVENDTNKNQTIDNNDIDFYVSVDDGDAQLVKDTSVNGKFTIPFSSKDVGDHTITVRAVDPKYIGSDGIADTLSSNTVTYNVTVADKQLKINSDSPSDLSAVGNTDLSIDANDNYTDNSSFKNSDMTLHTVINGTETTSKLTGDDSITSGKFTANIPANLIEAGKTNTVDIYLTDSATPALKSNTLSYNVTVPETVLNLTADKTELKTFVNKDATLSGKISYADNTQFKNSDMTLHINIDGTNQASEQLTGDTNATTNSFDKVFSGLSVDTHTITLYVTDTHGRKSKSQVYTVEVLDKELLLESKGEYDFQFIRASDHAQTIGRQDDWGIQVDSTNTAWALTAESTALATKSGETFNGGLIFTDKNGDTLSIQNNPVLIDKDTTVSPNHETTDVSKLWAKDQGILLHVNSGLVPSGKYNGTITWNLSDSV